MMNYLRHGRSLLIGGLLLPLNPQENDVLSKDTKTYRAFIDRPPSKETGWERIKEMFTIDEFGNISCELNSVYQAGFSGFLFGGIYGGFINSRNTYENFMFNNQATAFKSHLDAKRKLQNEYTVSFAKGAFKWGWRVSLFTMSYFGIITLVSVYREKSSIYEYVAAGTITGSFYKLSMGLRGMAVGGLLGGVLGSIAGVASLALIQLSGTSMEEIRYWQYKWRSDRNDVVRDALVASGDQPPELVKHHDEKLGEDGKKVSLDSVQ